MRDELKRDKKRQRKREETLWSASSQTPTDQPTHEAECQYDLARTRTVKVCQEEVDIGSECNKDGTKDFIRRSNSRGSGCWTVGQRAKGHRLRANVDRTPQQYPHIAFQFTRLCTLSLVMSTRGIFQDTGSRRGTVDCTHERETTCWKSLRETAAAV
ncbi:MAG: hypothetical protein M1824_003397 [Vezdaea acicularis]|nr:MAG: hypothetical protein M1824_003397 [Vezdaea acicularis]